MTTRQNQYRIASAASQKDCRRQVVNERNEKLKVFSKEGIRGDMVVAFFIIIFILFLGFCPWIFPCSAPPAAAFGMHLPD